MKKFLVIIIGLILALTSCKSNKYSDLTVTFLNVGKADAILLEWDNHIAIIDTAEESTKDVLLNKLEEKEITKIDFLLLSHFDKDHIGGASDIISKYEVKTIYQTYVSKASKEIKAYQNKLEELNITPVEVTKNYSFKIGSLSFSIFPPLALDYDNSVSNNSSLCLYLKYSKTTFLFPGDAEKARLKEIKNLGLQADVLKFPHHGNIEDNTESFLKAINPKYTIITSSDEEKESDEVITLLDFLNINTYLTRLGEVTIVSNGKKLTVTQKS